MFVLILMVDESLWMSFDQSSCPAFQINNFIITDINFIWQSSPREVYRPPDRPFHSSRQVTFWLKRLTDVQHHIFSLHVSLLSVHWQIIEEVRRRRRKRRRKRITEGAGLKGQVHASCLHSALLTSLLAVKDRINHAKDIPERKERNRRWREEGRWVKTRQRERESQSERMFRRDSRRICTHERWCRWRYKIVAMRWRAWIHAGGTTNTSGCVSIEASSESEVNSHQEKLVKAETLQTGWCRESFLI